MSQAVNGQGGGDTAGLAAERGAGARAMLVKDGGERRGKPAATVVWAKKKGPEKGRCGEESTELIRGLK